MNARKQLIFWIVSFAALTLLFSKSLGGFVLSVYFVSFLLPVILSTTYVFNRFLVARFLLKGRRWRFSVYFLYLLIISIYLEMLVMVLAFVILADYQFENLGAIAGDIYLLAVILYLIVFSNGFIEIIIGFQRKTQLLKQIEDENTRDQKDFIHIRSNRKNLNLEIDTLVLIESLADYVQIHTKGAVYITKQKISSLESNLPNRFIRIHRSYIVNTDKIIAFNKESVQLEHKELTFGRKYKEQALNFLNAMATADSTTHLEAEKN